MGGGPSAPSAPQAPPSVGETSAQAIQSQIDALPKILAAQTQYGSQFSQLNLDQLNQFGPAFAKATLGIQDLVAPEVSAAQKTLTDYLGGSDQQEYDALKPGLLDNIRSAQSQRGLGAISPLGSIDESVQLQQLKENLRNRRLNISLSTAGRVPIGQISPTTGSGQLIQNIDPNSTFGYQQSVNAFNSSIFNTQGGIYGAQLQQQGNPLGSILGGVSGGAGAAGTAFALAKFAPMLACWVASEVLEEPMDGPRVSNVRKYILNDAPDWFRSMYIKYGKQIAEFIHDREEDKAILRPLFEMLAMKGAA